MDALKPSPLRVYLTGKNGSDASLSHPIYLLTDNIAYVLPTDSFYSYENNTYEFMFDLPKLAEEVLTYPIDQKYGVSFAPVGTTSILPVRHNDHRLVIYNYLMWCPMRAHIGIPLKPVDIYDTVVRCIRAIRDFNAVPDRSIHERIGKVVFPVNDMGIDDYSGLSEKDVIQQILSGLRASIG